MIKIATFHGVMKDKRCNLSDIVNAITIKSKTDAKKYLITKQILQFLLFSNLDITI